MIDFAKIQFDHETTENLFEYCKLHHLGMADIEDQSSLSAADFKFHLTVMYSKVTSDRFVEGRHPVEPRVLKPESFAMFGPANDLLVMRLRLEPFLSSLFEDYGRVYGHVSDFMPYRPHITIRGSSTGVSKRIGSLPTPDFPITAAHIVHSRKTG